METDPDTSILALNVDVLCEIAKCLGAVDLSGGLSSTCKFFRKLLDIESLWKYYVCETGEFNTGLERTGREQGWRKLFLRVRFGFLSTLLLIITSYDSFFFATLIANQSS
jgi:hypothetical protein